MNGTDNDGPKASDLFDLFLIAAVGLSAALALAAAAVESYYTITVPGL
jgi:hypothetical protein